MHLVRRQNQGLAMANINANGTYIRRSFIAACEKEKEPPDEERGHTVRQWRIESETVTMPNLAGPRHVITNAAKSYKIVLKTRIYRLQ